jgi:glyoxylase-like metal-dependent hydrolase (beta-lactamase superfamily II)
MYFRQILHEEKACASYMIGCPSNGVCAVVDPQGDPGDYLKLAESAGMSTTHVIETHIHADHLSSARQLAGLSGGQIYLGAGAQVGYEYAPLADNQILEVGNRRIRILHTPGHTPEHICLLGDGWYLLTGDTLFIGDVGRVDLSVNHITPAEIEDRAVQLHGSLQRLLKLPDWIEVYPGHYAGSVCGRGMDGKTISTIGHERRMNPALKFPLENFVRYQLESLLPLPDDFYEIKKHNLSSV